ncbi:unnamed protein product [Prorocentrum cordatum]|uniref:Ion transport domain-containing protein n=1 Tax=Prorocentrum cordatum TaxID=2364126 RepID=A0ABN9TTH4_9DINO|nr:unnamed protein product [Polarella glacialis]
MGALSQCGSGFDRIEPRRAPSAPGPAAPPPAHAAQPPRAAHGVAAAQLDAPDRQPQQEPGVLRTARPQPPPQPPQQQQVQQQLGGPPPPGLQLPGPPPGPPPAPPPAPLDEDALAIAPTPTPSPIDRPVVKCGDKWYVAGCGPDREPPSEGQGIAAALAALQEQLTIHATRAPWSELKAFPPVPYVPIMCAPVQIACFAEILARFRAAGYLDCQELPEAAKQIVIRQYLQHGGGCWVEKDPDGLLTASGAQGQGSAPASPSSRTASTVDGQAAPRTPVEGWSPRLSSSTFKVLDTWERGRHKIRDRRPSMQSLYIRKSTLSSSNAVWGQLGDEEEAREPAWWEERLERLVVEPNSCVSDPIFEPPIVHICWESVGLCLVLYDVATAPLRLLDPLDGAAFLLAAWLARLFWTLDVPFSFLTGFVSPQGRIELRAARVAAHYARGRLPLDLAVLACDWAEALASSASSAGASGDPALLRLLALLRGVRLVRLVRLARAQHIAALVSQRVRSEGVKLSVSIALIMFALLVLIHVIACAWHGVRYGLERGTAQGHGLGEDYFEAFHCVLALFLGEHLVPPQSLGERVFTILVLVFSFMVSSCFVGSLTTAMTQLRIIAGKRSTQFAALNHYLSDAGISRELSARVVLNARHALREQKRLTPESSVELLQLISDPLRCEIHFEVFSPTLTVHPFFHLLNGVNPAGVRHVCHAAVSAVSLSRGDVLFSEFEVPTSPRMFFVLRGRLSYASGTEAQRVVDQAWLSEPVLWTAWAHRGTLRAQAEANLLALDAHRFINIMSTFPTLHSLNYATKFVENLNTEGAHDSLTDLGASEEEARKLAVQAFQEHDLNFEPPAEWAGGRRMSILSVASLLSATSLGATRPGRVALPGRRASSAEVAPASPRPPLPDT